MRNQRRRAAKAVPVIEPVVEGAPATPAVSPPAGGGQKVAKSVGWSALGRTGTQVLQFLAGLALARLLVPADFGLLASVYVVTGFTVLLFDMGLGNALIHRRDLRQQDLDSAFWLNTIGGLVFLGILSALGPVVAAFYGDPRLTYITPLAGLSFALALNVCHTALLQRDMQFKKVAAIELSSALLGNVTTVCAALADWGALALVTGPVIQAVVLTILSWAVVRWRPRGFVKRDSLRELWRFTGGMLGFNVVNYAARNSDNLLIGKFLGAASLGYYNRAYSLMLLPLQQISQVLGRVMFPALVAMRQDQPRMHSAYRRTISVMTAVTMPVLVGMAATADGLVPLLWGDQWSSTIPLLQILCLAGLPQCLSSSEGWLYQSQGRTSLMFKVGMFSTVLTLAAIVIGLHWGSIGVATGLLIKMWAWQPVGFHVACGTIGLRARFVFGDIAPIIALSLVMGGVVWAVPWMLDFSREDLSALLLQVAAGCLVYIGGLRILRPRLFRDVIALMPQRFVSGWRRSKR
jgi:PST family polysaccharide transporter